MFPTHSFNSKALEDYESQSTSKLLNILNSRVYNICRESKILKGYGAHLANYHGTKLHKPTEVSQC